MSEREVQETLNRLTAEIESIAERLDRFHLGLRADVDTLRIDLETLRRFLEKFHPEFADAYPELRDSVVRAVDPEFSQPPRRGT
jgi:hypothetical protein